MTITFMGSTDKHTLPWPRLATGLAQSCICYATPAVPQEDSGSTPSFQVSVILTWA